MSATYWIGSLQILILSFILSYKVYISDTSKANILDFFNIFSIRAFSGSADKELKQTKQGVLLFLVFILWLTNRN